jgi:hypothetical protein
MLVARFPLLRYLFGSHEQVCDRESIEEVQQP